MLTTHVLDTALGRPAEKVVVRLFSLDEEGARALLADTVTDEDGRTARPVIDTLAAGRFELVFAVAEYLARAHPDGAFYEDVPVRFTVRAPGHHHVPLLLSPFGYATYRGS